MEAFQVDDNKEENKDSRKPERAGQILGFRRHPLMLIHGDRIVVDQEVEVVKADVQDARKQANERRRPVIEKQCHLAGSTSAWKSQLHTRTQIPCFR